MNIARLGCMALMLAFASVSLANGTSKDDPKATASAEAGADAAASSDAVLSAEYKERLQAPSISAPPVYASGNCAYGWSVGVAVPGAGASGGKTTPDKDCNRRELVRVVTPLNPWLALKVACEDPLIVDMLLRGLASKEDCKYVAPVTKPNPPQVTIEDVRQEVGKFVSEVNERVDKSFQQAQKK